MSIGGNIKLARKNKKMKAQTLASIIGIAPGSLSHIENGTRNPSLTVLHDIAKALDVEVNTLIQGDPNNYINTVKEAPAITIRDIINIPIVGVIRAGQPILAVENIEGYMPVYKSTLSPNKEYFCLRVKGDSMNLEFKEGTILLVEKTSCIYSNDIGVILIDGLEATVKKIVKNDNIITLIPMSSNPEHIAKMYDVTKIEIVILGRVVQAVKMY